MTNDGTPAGVHGASWGPPDTPRPSAWEQQPQPADAPAAQPPTAAGGSAEPKQDERQSHQHERESWAAAYVRPDRAAAAAPGSQDLAASAAVSRTLQAVQADEDRRATDVASWQARPAFRERTDSAIYQRGDQEEAPEASSAPFRVVRLEALPSTVPDSARVEQLGGKVTGSGGGRQAAGKNKAETPRREGSRRVADANACTHVLQAELGSSEVQLCRRSRDFLDAHGALPGRSAAQVRRFCLHPMSQNPSEQCYE